MLKALNAAKKREIFKKIEIARKIAKIIQQDEDDLWPDEFRSKLMDAADRYELTLNDVLVKRYKWKSALQKMRKYEKLLDELISQGGVRKKIFQRGIK
ncbi:MAG TPA: hypothetical protein VGK25_07295 [Ignavibacteria bacterium]|jgi:hypothetical protein